MIGIQQIGIYIPNRKIENATKRDAHNITTEFLEKKIGIRSVSRMADGEKASDLCVHAFTDLLTKCGAEPQRIDFICVCTQNGDYRLPQTSAIVHEKLELPYTCAAMDIGLGCSGYVYTLLVARSFMESNGLRCGVIFTSDPYSTIIDPADKNTDLLFGDAATATLLTDDARYDIGKGAFGTDGGKHAALIKRNNEKLFMDGRGIYNFALRTVPHNLQNCFEVNGISPAEVDVFIFHQASKFLIDTLAQKMKIDTRKVPFRIQNYGNTVSSSIPIILKDYMGDQSAETLLLSGFGVGLSVASLVLRRR